MRRRSLLRPWLIVGLAMAVGAAGCSKRVVQQPDLGQPPAKAPRTVQHEVSAGETLTLIADNYFGDPARAGRIAAQNGIQDPARLQPGSVLLLQFDQAEWLTGQRRAAAMSPYNRGVGLFEGNDLAGAEREFRLALEISPDFINARYNLALVLAQRGRHEEAETLLTELLADRPGEPDFQFAYGHVLFQEGRFSEAAGVFAQLLTTAPDHRRGAFSYARSLQEAGRKSEAIAGWRSYLELDPSSSWAEIAHRNLDKLQGE